MPSYSQKSEQSIASPEVGRLADVATYWRVRDELDAQGGQTLQLTTSYRSVPSIQRFVNAAFARHRHCRRVDCGVAHRHEVTALGSRQLW